MDKKQLTREELELLEKIKQSAGKRARLVIDHIIEHGSVTTEQLRDLGYIHPPRAPGDLKECGIPILSGRVKNSQGRYIAQYTFGDLSLSRAGMGGRRALPKKLKESLVKRDGSQCSICGVKLDPRYLQNDHRIPFLGQ